MSSAAPATLTAAKPSAQVAGTPFSVTLTATDAYSNPESGTQNVTFSGPSDFAQRDRTLLPVLRDVHRGSSLSTDHPV